MLNYLLLILLISGIENIEADTKAPYKMPSVLSIKGDLARGRHLVLTFDDGPSYKTTPKLLNILDELNLKAVFFVNGRRFRGKRSAMRKNAEILADEAKRGHYIGNHTFSHPMMNSIPPKKQKWQILRNEKVIAYITRYNTRLYRPPFGQMTSYSRSLLRENGYSVVMWNLDSSDPFQRRTAKVFRNIINEIYRHDHGVMLFHDTHKWSVNAIPRIVKAIRLWNCELNAQKDQVYEFVTLDELGRNGKGKFDEPSEKMILKALKRKKEMKKWCNALK